MVLQNFIVLGIIPGTDIQIDFQSWLTVVLILVFLWQLRRLYRSKVLVALQLRYFTYKLANELKRI